MHHQHPLEAPTWQPVLSQLTRPQIDQIAQQLFRLRGPGDASDPMPLEISYGAHVAMRLNPPERRLGPLLGTCHPESAIDPRRMGLKILDEGHGTVHAVRVDGFVIGLSGGELALPENEGQACPVPLELRNERPQSPAAPCKGITV
jgi:hypothetical protein